ncbi:EamA family transporter [Gordonia terrae]|uniref:EamA family transporter n=1 Tax=Gordonia terrae TaxID=2055 RepID=UPI003F6CCF6D
MASPLFTDMGPTGVAAWRQVIGGLALLVLLRPTLSHRPPRTWLLIVGLGTAMAGMNVLYYSAVDRLPLGVAASLLYLGPFVLATVAIRDRRQLIWPVFALAGVLAVTRPDQAIAGTLWGVLAGALAAAALALYTLLSHNLGSRAGYGELALAVAFSGLILTPVAITHTPPASSTTWLTLTAIGVIGVGVAFLLDFIGLRLAGPVVVATLFAFDPAIGAILGSLVLGERLTAITLAGIGLIVAAGIGLTRPTTSRLGPRRPNETDVQ